MQKGTTQHFDGNCKSDVKEVFFNLNHLKKANYPFFKFLQNSGIDVNKITFPCNIKTGETFFISPDLEIGPAPENVLGYGITEHKEQARENIEITKNDKKTQYYILSINGCKIPEAVMQEIKCMQDVVFPLGISKPFTIDTLRENAKMIGGIIITIDNLPFIAVLNNDREKEVQKAIKVAQKDLLVKIKQTLTARMCDVLADLSQKMQLSQEDREHFETCFEMYGVEYEELNFARKKSLRSTELSKEEKDMFKFITNLYNESIVYTSEKDEFINEIEDGIKLFGLSIEFEDIKKQYLSEVQKAMEIPDFLENEVKECYEKFVKQADLNKSYENKLEDKNLSLSLQSIDDEILETKQSLNFEEEQPAFARCDNAQKKVRSLSC